MESQRSSSSKQAVSQQRKYQGRQEDQRLIVQEDWRELSSERRTGGNTVSTDPGLCPNLRQRSNPAKPASFCDGKGDPA